MGWTDIQEWVPAKRLKEIVHHTIALIAQLVGVSLIHLVSEWLPLDENFRVIFIYSEMLFALIVLWIWGFQMVKRFYKEGSQNALYGCFGLT